MNMHGLHGGVHNISDIRDYINCMPPASQAGQAPRVQNNKVGGRLPTILEPVTSIACLCMLPTFVA